MTNNQIIKTLENIKEHCLECPNCNLCRFSNKKSVCYDCCCQIDALALLLTGKPAFWDIDLLERILNE